MHSLSSDIIISVVYGTAATAIGLVTIYQAHKAWNLWHAHRQNEGRPSPDVELGLGVSRSASSPPEITEGASPAQPSDEAREGGLGDIQHSIPNLAESSTRQSLPKLPTSSIARNPNMKSGARAGKDSLRPSLAVADGVEEPSTAPSTSNS